MKTLLVLLLVAMVPSAAPCDGFLYVLEKDAKTETRIRDGGRTKELAMPLSKAAITDAILRADSKDPSIVWLELHMADARDPGKVMWLFPATSGSRHLFKRSKSKLQPEGCKWVLRVDTVEGGRRVLAKVGKSYGLTNRHLKDETIEEGEGPNQGNTADDLE